MTYRLESYLKWPIVINFHNRDTSILKGKYETGDVKDTLLANQEREIDRNNSKLKSLKNDILTLRR